MPSRDPPKVSPELHGLLSGLDRRLDTITQRQDEEAKSVRARFEEQAKVAADIKEKLLNVESAVTRQNLELTAKLQMQSKDVELATKQTEIDNLKVEAQRMDIAARVELERVSTAKDLEKKTGLSIAGVSFKTGLIWTVLGALALLAATVLSRHL